MTVLIIIAMLLFLGFIAATIRKDKEIPDSYSELYYRWPTWSHTSVFSLVTFILAFLLMPPMIESGADSNFQFLGFFTPCYLIIVAFFPDYRLTEEGKWTVDRKVHCAGAALCAVGSFLWLCLTVKLWWLLLPWLLVCGLGAYYTKSCGKCWLLWLELVMFLSVFTTLFVAL